MSFIYEEKPSASPYVDVVWRTVDQSDGIYIASADGCWDMIFIGVANRGKTQVLLSGPSSKTTRVPYSAGNKNIGIRFKPETFFTDIPVNTMVNVTQALPMPTENTFTLRGIIWNLPTYQRIDEFITQLVERGLLSSDPIVKAVLEHQAVNMTERSIQRHFIQTTGLTPHRVQQIIRARKAVELLQRGLPIAEVAHELDYADQAHMTRMLKRYTGFTPMRNKQRGEPV